MKRKEFANYLDNLLKIGDYRSDASNNGLQYEGKNEIGLIAFGVDASLEFFEKALEAGADALFVHHGISWGDSLKRLVGVDGKRVAFLAKNDLSLYAAHLPLDANPAFGHNARIAALLKLEYLSPFGSYGGTSIGFRGTLQECSTPCGLAEKLDSLLPSRGSFQIFGDAGKKIGNVGIISGGGAWPGVFTEMMQSGVDCLVTGELTHQSLHYMLEAGVSVIAMGHYRSETPGVLAVMEDLTRNFGVKTTFLDLPTGL